jgi:hypothetical protein
MNQQPMVYPRKAYNRVEQKLKDLLRQRLSGKEFGDRVSGSSEETASLFSSGTVPAVRMTRESHG